jgi:4-amino-4-deoxy-L-arabinose transferase-like glycosyltransferase
VQRLDPGRPPLLTAPFWARPGFVFSAILLYLAVHFAIRLAMGPALSNDDAEQAYFSQGYAWAYRYKAPPLFTWILVTLGQLMPIGAAAIALIRYALLGFAYSFIYLTARRLIDDARLSALAVYSFAALSPFAEATHRNLTHSTALIAASAAAWYVFARLAAAPHLGWYLALGAVSGFGLLAKWNFVILIAALFLACLLTPASRPLILTWKVVPAALVSAAIVLPTLIATLGMQPPAEDRLGTVLNTGGGRGSEQVLTGTLNLLETAVIFSLPFAPIVVLLFALPFWRGLRTGGAHSSVAEWRPDAAFVGTVMAVALGLLWMLVFVLGATQFKARYLYPVLLVLPPWFFMVLERGRPGARALTLFVLVLAALTIFVAGKRIGRVAGVVDCGLCPEWMPYRSLANDLRDAGYAGAGTILTAMETGGNLRPLFPRARVIDPDYPPGGLPEPSGPNQCLILWTSGDTGRREFALRYFAGFLTDSLQGDVDARHREGTLAAPMIAPAEGTLRLDYRLYDGPNGTCR